MEQQQDQNREIKDKNINGIVARLKLAKYNLATIHEGMKLGHLCYELDLLDNNEPHRVELNTASERELEHPDSCKITLPEPSQPSRLDGRCKAQPDNARSRCRNNDGSCKVK